MSVCGIGLAGWASNNKYALLGGLRSSAQMISYELPMSMAIAAPLLMCNTLSLAKLVEAQSGFYFGAAPKWNIVAAPIAFVIFPIAGFAETNRLPFVRPEGDKELR